MLLYFSSCIELSDYFSVFPMHCELFEGNDFVSYCYIISTWDSVGAQYMWSKKRSFMHEWMTGTLSFSSDNKESAKTRCRSHFAKLAISKKHKHIITIQPCNSTPRYPHERNESLCPHKDVHANICNSITHNNPKLETI